MKIIISNQNIKTTFEYKVDEDGGLFIDEPEIGYVFGKDKEELTQNVYSQIEFLWAEYVMADIKDLTEDAVKLRKNLLKRFKVLI